MFWLDRLAEVCAHEFIQILASSRIKMFRSSCLRCGLIPWAPSSRCIFSLRSPYISYGVSWENFSPVFSLDFNFTHLLINLLISLQGSFPWWIWKSEEGVWDSWHQQRWLHIQTRTSESTVWFPLLPGRRTAQYSPRQVSMKLWLSLQNSND